MHTPPTFTDELARRLAWTMVSQITALGIWRRLLLLSRGTARADSATELELSSHETPAEDDSPYDENEQVYRQLMNAAPEALSSSMSTSAASWTSTTTPRACSNAIGKLCCPRGPPT